MDRKGKFPKYFPATGYKERTPILAYERHETGDESLRKAQYALVTLFESSNFQPYVAAAYAIDTIEKRSKDLGAYLLQYMEEKIIWRILNKINAIVVEVALCYCVRSIFPKRASWQYSAVFSRYAGRPNRCPKSTIIPSSMLFPLVHVLIFEYFSKHLPSQPSPIMDPVHGYITLVVNNSISRKKGARTRQNRERSKSFSYKGKVYDRLCSTLGRYYGGHFLIQGSPLDDARGCGQFGAPLKRWSLDKFPREKAHDETTEGGLKVKRGELFHVSAHNVIVAYNSENVFGEMDFSLDPSCKMSAKFSLEYAIRASHKTQPETRRQELGFCKVFRDKKELKKPYRPRYVLGMSKDLLRLKRSLEEDEKKKQPTKKARSRSEEAILSLTMKYCTKCKQIKALTEFTKRSASSDGFAYRCKVCTSASSKKWLKNNPGKRNGNKKGSKSPASSTIADDHSRDLVGEKIEDIRAAQEILAKYDDGEESSTEPLSHDSTDTAKKWQKNNREKRNGNEEGSKSPASSTIADDHSRDLVGEKIEDIRAEQEILATYDDGEEPSTEPLGHDSTDTSCNGEVLYIQRPLVLKIYL
jgi:hypothetical protein